MIHKQTSLGTRVTVHRDNGQDMVTATRSFPWELPSGDWVVQLEGITGCYILDKVDLLQTPPEMTTSVASRV